MANNRQLLIRRIRTASKKEPADLVIKNGKIVDVFSGDLLQTDVAITDGMIVGLGNYEGKQMIDAQGKIISPSLIDAHVHIESSMLTPGAFSDVLAAHGVTSAITDPHEIANVLGAGGIRFMLERAKESSIDLYIMLPSSVPATSFEHNGATLDAADLEPLFQYGNVLGLAEVMDFPAVLNADPKMVDKLAMTQKYSWRIDGHAAGLDARGVNVYKAAGIRTDHECVNSDEAKDRLSRGLYVMIRQGTVAKDLPQLISLVNETNSRRFLFCTDDKYPDDLIREGSVDHNVRLAIESGLDPITCIKMASLNVAECYGFREKGAIAPGYEANFLLLDDLDHFSIHQVYAHGKLVAENGKVVQTHTDSSIKAEEHSLTWPRLSREQFTISLGSERKAHVIGIIPNSLVTRDLVEQVPVQNGQFTFSQDNDYLKLAVIERHKGLGTIGLAIVKGLGMKSGAIATTIAHDSHNLVVTGCSDQDIIAAAERLKEIDGGMVVVNNGKILAELALPIAGLMTDTPAKQVAEALKKLREAATSLGASESFNPFLTLSFLSLPVIPNLKLTDTGLFDVRAFKHISASAD